MRQASVEVLVCSKVWLLSPPKQLHDAEFGQLDDIDHPLRVMVGKEDRWHFAFFCLLHEGL
jgi:hypothetical protein